MNQKEGLAAIALIALVSIVFLPFVGAGEFEFVFTAEDGNHFNSVIPMDFNHSNKTVSVVVGQSFWPSADGLLKNSLAEDGLFVVQNDGNVLFSVKSLDENSCDWFLDVSGLLYDLTVPGIKTVPVTVGQRIGLRFSVKSVTGRCQINFDMNSQWVE